MVNYNYKLDKISNEILEFKEIIKNFYQFDEFIFKLTFENKYNDENDLIVRFNLSNDLKNKTSNNGLITLYHKVYYLSDFENDNINQNDIILKFFEIQKDLKELNLTFELKDCTN